MELAMYQRWELRRLGNTCAYQKETEGRKERVEVQTSGSFLFYTTTWSSGHLFLPQFSSTAGLCLVLLVYLHLRPYSTFFYLLTPSTLRSTFNMFASSIRAVAANTITAANGTASATSAKAPAVDNPGLVFDIDLLLLSAVACFVLLLLPRAAIRFTHKREWVDGHFLRSIYLDGHPASIRRPAAKRQDVIAPVSPAYLANTYGNSEYGHDAKEQWGGSETDASHTYVSHADLLRKGSSASTRERRRQNVPTHMLGVSTILPGLASFLRTTLRPGLTIGKGCVLLAYFAIMLYGGLYKSNPFADPLRTGFLAVSQIPVVVLLGTKNNVLGMMIGFGYERVSSCSRKLEQR